MNGHYHPCDFCLLQQLALPTHRGVPGITEAASLFRFLLGAWLEVSGTRPAGYLMEAYFFPTAHVAHVARAQVRRQSLKSLANGVPSTSREAFLREPMLARRTVNVVLAANRYSNPYINLDCDLYSDPEAPSTD